MIMALRVGRLREIKEGGMKATEASSRALTGEPSSLH